MTQPTVWDTTTTYEEIGRAFVSALCASRALGHVSPAGLADYAEGETVAERVVVAAFASTRLDDRAKPAEAAVDEWLTGSTLASDTMRRGAEAAGRIG